MVGNTSEAVNTLQIERFFPMADSYREAPVPESQLIEALKFIAALPRDTDLQEYDLPIKSPGLFCLEQLWDAGLITGNFKAPSNGDREGILAINDARLTDRGRRWLANKLPRP